MRNSQHKLFREQLFLFRTMSNAPAITRARYHRPMAVQTLPALAAPSTRCTSRTPQWRPPLNESLWSTEWDTACQNMSCNSLLLFCLILFPAYLKPRGYKSNNTNTSWNKFSDVRQQELKQQYKVNSRNTAREIINTLCDVTSLETYEYLPTNTSWSRVQ